MAKLRVPVDRAGKMLANLIQVGEEVAAKVDLAAATRGYRDWLDLFATWRKGAIAELKTIYVGKDAAMEFEFATETSERSSSSSTFEYRKGAVRYGIQKLKSMIERLPLALAESEDAAGIKSLHPEIYSRCHTLYAGGDYAETVEKGFKVVRDRLRSLTTHETGSEAFGKGKLYVDGAAAQHVDDDFQEWCEVSHNGN